MKEIIELFCLLGYLAWKKHHLKTMVDEIRNNTNGKIGNDISSAIYAAGIIIVVIGGLDYWGVFAQIYIAIPLAISGLYILRYRDKKIINAYLCLKGLYYLSLAIYSIWQYYSESQRLSELAIGFTIALAIFESVTALRESVGSLIKKDKA